MFIAVFNDVIDIYMINSILRIHKYHQILQRRALTRVSTNYLHMAVLIKGGNLTKGETKNF